MKFRAEDYYYAAQERFRDAESLYQSACKGDSSFSASLYLSGLAVECMARAYRVKLGLPFDDKHDIHKLFETRVIDVFSTEKSRRRVTSAISTTYIYWQNRYRYASDSQLESIFRKIHRGQRIRGEHIKNACINMREAMTIVLREGVAKWNS